MQITLTEREIHAAVRKYIIARLRLSPSEEIKVDLMATRGADGFKAVLDIIEPEEADNTPAMPGTMFVPEVGVRTPVQVPEDAFKPAPTVTLQFSAEPVSELAAAADAVVGIIEQTFNIPTVKAPKAAAPVVKAVVPAVVDDIPPFDVPAPAPKVSGLFAHLANN